MPFVRHLHKPSGGSQREREHLFKDQLRHHLTFVLSVFESARWLMARSVRWQITHMKPTSAKHRVRLPVSENVKDRSELNLDRLCSISFICCCCCSCCWQLPGELNCQQLNVAHSVQRLHRKRFEFLLRVRVDHHAQISNMLPENQ